MMKGMRKSQRKSQRRSQRKRPRQRVAGMKTRRTRKRTIMRRRFWRILDVQLLCNAGGCRPCRRGRTNLLRGDLISSFTHHFNFGTDETFNRINQYFDGKCTDDEILFRAEISRRQLREVLHVYDEYVGVAL